MLKGYLNNYSHEKKMKNKIAKITASAILVLITNSLPSNALNESSVARLPIESETQTNQVTEEKAKPLIDKIRSLKLQPSTTTKPSKNDRRICYRRWIYNWKLKRWVTVCTYR